MPQLVEPDRPPPPASPLIMSDRLLRLAQDAARAGFARTAEHLLELAHTVLEERRGAA